MNQWAIGIATSLIATIIIATVARLIPSVPDVATVWRHYWPEAVGLAAGAMWFGGYRVWLIWSRLQRRLAELERQASDQHVAFVFYEELNKQKVIPEVNSIGQRVSRLEEWKLQGGGDSVEAIAHRALRSGIDPKRGGMDVKP
jgi:hypothetical protein